MTNTPMTFEEWAEDNMHMIDDMVYAKEIWQASQAQQATVIAELQAKIDALMFEYCPEEMTQEQKNNFSHHQKQFVAKVKGK